MGAWGPGVFSDDEAADARGTATTWPMLARSLGDAAYRSGRRLACDPQHLAERQREILPANALSGIAFFDGWIARHEDGKPLFEPHDIGNYVAHVRGSLT